LTESSPANSAPVPGADDLAGLQDVRGVGALERLGSVLLDYRRRGVLLVDLSETGRIVVMEFEGKIAQGAEVNVRDLPVARSRAGPRTRGSRAVFVALMHSPQPRRGGTAHV